MVDRAASSSGSDGAAARTLIELVRQNAQREGTTLAYRFVHCDGAAQLSYAEVEFHARCVAVCNASPSIASPTIPPNAI